MSQQQPKIGNQFHTVVRGPASKAYKDLNLLVIHTFLKWEPKSKLLCQNNNVFPTLLDIFQDVPTNLWQFTSSDKRARQWANSTIHNQLPLWRLRPRPTVKSTVTYLMCSPIQSQQITYCHEGFPFCRAICASNPFPQYTVLEGCRFYV